MAPYNEGYKEVRTSEPIELTGGAMYEMQLQFREIQED